jgi:outer membrane receptor protein involved in Fe transport
LPAARAEQPAPAEAPPANSGEKAALAGPPPAVEPENAVVEDPPPATAEPENAVLEGPPPAAAEPENAVLEGPPPAAAEPESVEAPPPAAEPDAIVVRSKRPTSAASAQVVRDRDFRLRTMRRPADLLEVAPGLVVVQHAGGGKANQYFLRGFDADHGTDVALFVDGVPVNQVSHAHGQGYADLNWILPDVVERVEIYKGPYFTRLGDFATAGAVNLVTRREVEENEITAGGGMFDTVEGRFVAAPRFDDAWTGFAAARVFRTDGPFDHPEDTRLASAFGRVGRAFEGGGGVWLTTTAYVNGWHGSGQVPDRKVRSGELSRFGAVDPDEGGSSSRHSVYVNVDLPKSASETLSLQAYLVRYRLALYSNFTFFSEDPEHGDMIEQDDDRTTVGASAEYGKRFEIADMVFRTSFGAQLRSDDADTALWHDEARERLEARVDANVQESSVGVFAEEDVQWTPWLRTVAGVRADTFVFAVDDALEDRATPDTKTSGVARGTQLSPKATVILSPLADLDLFANFGVGFHSNDARGTVRSEDPVTPLTRATGGELGARTRLFDRIDLAGSFWGLDLEGETVWVGDEGTTESRGPTRRYGAEAEVRARILPWLYADADYTWTRARFTDLPDGEDEVPLAPRTTLQGGLAVRNERGPYGRLGVVHVGDRPATEDGFITAEGFTRLDLTVGWRADAFRLDVGFANLLNAEYAEAQFANTSRLPDETSPADCPGGTRGVVEDGAFAGCEDRHFAPGPPFNVRADLTLFF